MAKRVPQGVLCLISALSFHELTTQVPHAIDVALERGKTKPRLDYPPTRFFWFSGPAFHEGIETHELDGVQVRIYDQEKTLVDCFRYRNQIGMDVARDRDSKFGADFDRVAVGAGARVIKCPVRAPLVNATCERFLGSARRECLDHIVILGIRHLQATLGEYVAYFNASRPHQGLKQRIPVGSATFDGQAAGAVRAIAILGALHHDYRRAA